MQMLPNNRCLVVTQDSARYRHVYVSPVSTIGAVIPKSPQKTFPPDKIGEQCAMAYDEDNRYLYVCSPSKVRDL